MDPDNWTPDIDSSGTPSLTGAFLDPDEDSVDWATSGSHSDTGPLIAVEPE